MNSKSNAKKSGRFLSSYISNPKEYRMIVITFIITICLFSLGLLLISLSYQQLMMQGYKQYKEIFKQLGSISRIIYFAVLSIYPVFLLLKWKRLKMVKWRVFELKTVLQFIGKLVRRWHVPLAIVSTGIVLLHGYLAIIRGFKWDFTNITGILTIILLFFLLFMGLKRYKRLDKKWHFKLAVGFLILFMIHASF